MSALIRPATPADVGDIARLIRSLAEYEKLLHEAVATEEQLRESLFGPKPAAEVLMATVAERSVGFALFFHNYSTFLGRRGIYLEDLFVEPAHRGEGIGKALLQAVARLAVERGCGRFEWAVLEWNKPAIEFYQSFGARRMEDWQIFRLTGEALSRFGGRG